ncbi:hypothetical protein F3Y22_tig00111794pilonHSYRG00134 [Hibiscus syriacus]|uniref:Uncharacterized protein n=1 Tax=Hibiscus syriacus TaxID=106335 RepID=A0A6A2XCJ1_HIBSY|nr:hypothetical protein F3Y22_tig00111794pilonHSYRG00134 [Hibiscus syriacus]
MHRRWCSRVRLDASVPAARAPKSIKETNVESRVRRPNILVAGGIDRHSPSLWDCSPAANIKGWQVFTIGTVRLVFEVSSLYSISVSTVGLPIVPVLAVFVFHDKMDEIKGMSMVLAIWGFVSYIYQHYIDHKKSKIQNRITSEIADEDCLPAYNIA